MVCDYCALSKIPIPDSNPLPLIDETLDQAAEARIFSQIVLIGAYHQMHIRDIDCPKMAIRTCFGTFELRVLCFGLTNALAAFTRLPSNMLQELNRECCVLFMDDVVIYNSTNEEHIKHLRRLFEILRANKLYVRSSKCHIGTSEVDFLGYHVSCRGVTTQRRLFDALAGWPAPTSAQEAGQFLGLKNFYRRFIKD